MAGKGGSGFRTNHSSTGFSGSGGVEGNTRLDKYTKKKEQSLESIVNESYKNIDKTLEARAKTTLKYLAPGVYHGLILLEFLYKHRRVIMKTIDMVAEIWSDGSTPVSDKVLSTAGEVVKGGVEIAKDEFKEKGITYIAGVFANQATEAIDQTGAIDTVSNAVGLSDHKDRFKDLLEDTIEKQTEIVLKKAMGDKK